MHKPNRHPSPKESVSMTVLLIHVCGYNHWQFMLHTNCCHFYSKSFKINSPLASIDHYRVNAEHVYHYFKSSYLVNIFPKYAKLTDHMKLKEAGISFLHFSNSCTIEVTVLITYKFTIIGKKSCHHPFYTNVL